MIFSIVLGWTTRLVGSKEKRCLLTMHEVPWRRKPYERLKHILIKHTTLLHTEELYLGHFKREVEVKQARAGCMPQKTRQTLIEEETGQTAEWYA